MKIWVAPFLFPVSVSSVKEKEKKCRSHLHFVRILLISIIEARYSVLYGSPPSPLPIRGFTHPSDKNFYDSLVILLALGGSYLLIRDLIDSMVRLIPGED
jgi:hypothetical protein